MRKIYAKLRLDKHWRVIWEGDAHVVKKTHDEHHKLLTPKSVFRDLIIATVMVFVLSGVMNPALVHETSMQPTIDPRDFIIINKMSYRTGEIRRGDIVVFDSELKTKGNENKLLIKRVVGLPGDVLTIANGNLYRNGDVIAEKYIFDDQTIGDLNNLVVDTGEVFVMGDHRSVSRDSRELGCIKKNKIKGKAVFRLLPISKIGALK